MKKIYILLPGTIADGWQLQTGTLCSSVMEMRFKISDWSNIWTFTFHKLQYVGSKEAQFLYFVIFSCPGTSTPTLGQWHTDTLENLKKEHNLFLLLQNFVQMVFLSKIKTKRQKYEKIKLRKKDKKTKRHKGNRTKRQKYQWTKRPKQEFHIVMSGQFRTLAMFSFVN